MRTISHTALLAILGLLITVTFACAQAADETAFNFYDKLADIIKANTTNPSLCVSEVEKFVNANRDNIKKIRTTMEEATAKAKAGRAPTMTPEEAGEALEHSDLAEALDKFTTVFSAFSMDNPNEASQIEKLVQDQ